MGKLREFGIIISGGALGGIVSVLEAWTEPQSYPLSITKIFLLLVLPFVKGGIAAGIGVYVLTNLDPKQMARAFFFSVACGLTFPSILSKGESMAKGVAAQVASQSFQENARVIRNENGLKPDNIDVGSVKDASMKIFEVGSKMPANEKHEAESAIREAIDVLSKKAHFSEYSATGGMSAMDAISAIDAMSAIGARAIDLNLATPQNVVRSKLLSLRNRTDLPIEITSRAGMAMEMLGREQP